MRFSYIICILERFQFLMLNLIEMKGNGYIIHNTDILEQYWFNVSAWSHARDFRASERALSRASAYYLRYFASIHYRNSDLLVGVASARVPPENEHNVIIRRVVHYCAPIDLDSCLSVIISFNYSLNERLWSGEGRRSRPGLIEASCRASSCESLSAEIDTEYWTRHGEHSDVYRIESNDCNQSRRCALPPSVSYLIGVWYRERDMRVTYKSLFSLTAGTLNDIIDSNE